MAKPQVKKSLETFNQELAAAHMTGQWIYEDLLNRAIGGPRPRGASRHPARRSRQPGPPAPGDPAELPPP